MAVKILMADGDHAALELARSSISTLQWCDLVTVKDGREASKLLQSQKFDGVVMADSVPHVDGFELIQHLRLSPLNAGIPIVMLTCGDVIDTMRRGFKAGVTFFAVKPSNRERFFHLFNAVRGAMENERRRHHRLPYRTPVTCALGDQGKNRFVAESVDISGGGMSVRPSGGAEVGQILELEFLMPQISRPVHPAVTPKSQKVPFAERDIPAAAPQKVHARVCYVAPSGESMGLDFQDLTPKQSDAIGHYILGGS